MQTDMQFCVTVAVKEAGCPRLLTGALRSANRRRVSIKGIAAACAASLLGALPCASQTAAVGPASADQPSSARGSGGEQVSADNVSDPRLTGEKPTTVGRQLSVPGENPGYLFDLSSVGKDVGRNLAKQGIYLHGSLQQATQSVLSGGRKQGTEYVGLGFWGVDIDMEKKFGLTGGLFDVTFANQMGNTTQSKHFLGSNSFNSWAFGPGLGLVDFYYDQRLFDGALHITLGRTNQLQASPFTTATELSPAFHIMPFYCNFFTLSCGDTHAFNVDANKAGYKEGTWGGFATYHPAPHLYLKAGVFENDQLQTLTRADVGFPGADWAHTPNGTYFPFQLGYVTSAAETPYPTNAHIGGYVDTATYADKYLNSQMQPIALRGGTPLYHSFASGIFAGIQQTIYRLDEDPDSTRTISIFASGDYDTTGYQVDRYLFITGFIFNGPFAQRTSDSFNFLFSTQAFDPRQAAALSAIGAAHHVSYNVRGEKGFEVNYAFALAPGASFSPYIQYVLNPDQLSLAVPNPFDTHAIAVGARLLVRFDTLLGLPQYQR